MKNNSTIYKNVEDPRIFDLSLLGTVNYVNNAVSITQKDHFFQIGDVLFYNVQESCFLKAYAVNDIQSEVCGVVSRIFDKDNFEILPEGLIETSRYTFDIGTILYLSEVTPGKLISIPPSNIVKQIATQTSNGIIVNIKRGYHAGNPKDAEGLEPYTQEELDEIIKNIW